MVLTLHSSSVYAFNAASPPSRLTFLSTWTHTFLLRPIDGGGFTQGVFLWAESPLCSLTGTQLCREMVARRVLTSVQAPPLQLN